MKHSIRRRVAAGFIISGLLATAACGGGDSGGAGGAADSPAISVWSTAGTDDVINASADRWNAAKGTNLSPQSFENDPYKSKLRTAISAGEGPTIFSGWGGGVLKTYVDAGEVESLQAALDAEPELRDRYFSSVLKAATVDGEVYAIPYNGVAPVIIYTNKDVFDQTGVEVPTTWDELMTTVSDLRDAGVAPFSIGGANKWPYLMWIAYLTDRIGGPEVFERVVNGEEGAWLDPAITQAASMIQDLVDAGGFVDGFSSVDANQGAAEALLYTGKAAMQLQGAWAYSNAYLPAAPDFVEAGTLGWTTFPTVAGGQGDPSNLTGNLANFFSVTSRSSDQAKEQATDWLLHGVLDDKYVDELMDTGAVPPVSGLEDRIEASDAPEWNQFVYGTAQAADAFQLSWDQALDAQHAQALLTNLEMVFLGQITPEGFATAMDEAAR